MIAEADTIITDPPFGISFSEATWEDSIQDYPELMRWLVLECNRIVTNGWCFVFQAMPNAPRFHEWFGSNWRIYAACKNFAQIRPNGIWHSWDPVVFWMNGKPVKQKGEEAINRDYWVNNVAGLFSEQIGHPSPKCVDAMQHIISISTSRDKLIIDPFMGSGTTLKAAKNLGRQAIGIEINESYCKIAVDRLRQEVLFK